jgi:hypothetical protein
MATYTVGAYGELKIVAPVPATDEILTDAGWITEPIAPAHAHMYSTNNPATALGLSAWAGPLANATGVAELVDFVEDSDGVLKYTGASTRVFRVAVALCARTPGGAPTGNYQYRLNLNNAGGVAGFIACTTHSDGVDNGANMCGLVTLSTNDTLQVDALNNGADDDIEVKNYAIMVHSV